MTMSFLEGFQLLDPFLERCVSSVLSWIPNKVKIVKSLMIYKKEHKEERKIVFLQCIC